MINDIIQVEEVEEKQALRERMVRDLERFLGAALAGEGNKPRAAGWPVRYNWPGAAGIQRYFSKDAKVC